MLKMWDPDFFIFAGTLQNKDRYYSTALVFHHDELNSFHESFRKLWSMWRKNLARVGEQLGLYYDHGSIIPSVLIVNANTKKQTLGHKKLSRELGVWVLSHTTHAYVKINKSHMNTAVA